MSYKSELYEEIYDLRDCVYEYEYTIVPDLKQKLQTAEKKINELEKELEYYENIADQYTQHYIDEKQKLKTAEKDNKVLREALRCEKVALLHNYFRGILSIESNDHIQRREDKELFDFTLELKQALEKIENMEEKNER